MSLKKMLMLASMALAAMAFAAPAAQGDVVLTDPVGVPLEPGAGVTATSTNLTTTVGENQLTCDLVTLHYEVETNGLDHVVLQPTSAHNATADDCVIDVGGMEVPTAITNAGAGELTIDTWGTGETNATFTSGGFCQYTGSVHVQAEQSGSDILNVNESLLFGNPLELCGVGVIHGDVTLETPNGVPVVIDFEETS